MYIITVGGAETNEGIVALSTLPPVEVVAAASAGDITKAFNTVKKRVATIMVRETEVTRYVLRCTTLRAHVRHN